MGRDSGRTEEEADAEVTKDIAMGRLGEVDEFAAAVVFLTSELHIRSGFASRWGRVEIDLMGPANEEASRHPPGSESTM